MDFLIADTEEEDELFEQALLNTFDQPKSLSLKEIEDFYPTKTTDLSDGIRRMRILCDQTDEKGFKTLRGYPPLLSIGSSSAANAIGAGRGKPQEFLESLKLQILDEERYLCEKIQAQSSNNEILEKGHKYEPFTARVYEEITKYKLYNGCFMKVHFPSEPAKTTTTLDSDPNGTTDIKTHRAEISKLRDADFVFELNNNSSDGVVLQRDYVQNTHLTMNNVEIIRSSPDVFTRTVMRMGFSKIMGDLTVVSHGVEFKNPYYSIYDNIKIEHIVQCQYQCISLGVPFVDYLATFFNNETGLLQDILYIRVYKSELFIAEMIRRLQEFSCKLLSYYLYNKDPQKYQAEPPNLSYGIYDPDLLRSQCSCQILLKGNLQDLKLSRLARIAFEPTESLPLW